MQAMVQDTWAGAYREGWNGLIVAEAYSHPAKFARSLISRIYQHAREEGWLKPGDVCLDCFSGVSLGALDAALAGVQWIGVELEENFLILSHKNILFWIQKGWCACGDDDRAYVSLLRQSLSQSPQQRQSGSQAGESDGLLFQVLSHEDARQRQDVDASATPETSRPDTLEQREGVVSSDERKAQSKSAGRGTRNGKERALAGGAIAQQHGICRHQGREPTEVGTPLCDGTASGAPLNAQGIDSSYQWGQDGQSPGKSGVIDSQSAYEATQSPGTSQTREASSMSDMRGNGDDNLCRRSVTNSMLLVNLQARTTARISTSVQGPQACKTCGKLVVPLPVALQGDSRDLQGVLTRHVEACLASPPFPDNGMGDKRPIGGLKQMPHNAFSRAGAPGSTHYGTHPAQLGNLPPGTLAAAISSPPYADGCAHTGGPDRHPEHIAGGTQSVGLGYSAVVSSPPYVDGCVHDTGQDTTITRAGSGTLKRPWGTRKQGESLSDYGTHPAQLGAMKPGQVAAVVSSPPYAESLNTEKNGIDWSRMEGGKRDRTQETNYRTHNSSGITAQSYGTSPGQLGALPPGQVEAVVDGCVASPPWENQLVNHYSPEAYQALLRTSNGLTWKAGAAMGQDYGDSPNQLGTTHGPTFWEAARAIVEQVFQVLKPGGVAIWVTKNYVRNGQEVQFTQDWAKLCTSVGFDWLHHHQALLVEDHGTQGGLFGADTQYTTHRKSFFRRLAEKKGSPAINYESVLCFHKPHGPMPPDTAWQQLDLMFHRKEEKEE